MDLAARIWPGLFPRPEVGVYEKQVRTRDAQRNARFLPAIVVTLACTAMLSLFVGAGAAAEFPAIELEPTSNAALDDVLRSALNIPELERAAEADGSTQAQGWRPAAEAERHRLEELMRGQGYLEARVDMSDVAAGTDSAGKVLFKPNAGVLYRVGMVEVDGLDGIATDAVRDDISRQMMGAAGEPARGDLLATLEDEVLWRIRSASHPFVRVTDRAMMPIQGQALATVRIVVDPGVSAKFGSVTYAGLTGLKAQDLSRLQPFKQGDPYDPEVFDRFREALLAHPSVNAVRLMLPDAVDGKGQLQLHAELEEQQPSSDETTGNYRTGLVAAVSAISALAIRQVSVASLRPGRSRWPLWLEVVPVVLLAAAFFLIAQRLMLLAMPG
jgi:outer membrane translocation and assembly module TamA